MKKLASLALLLSLSTFSCDSLFHLEDKVKAIRESKGEIIAIDDIDGNGFVKMYIKLPEGGILTPTYKEPDSSKITQRYHTGDKVKVDRNCPTKYCVELNLD